jgi:hypothetical protein
VKKVISATAKRSTFPTIVSHRRDRRSEDARRKKEAARVLQATFSDFDAKKLSERKQSIEEEENNGEAKGGLSVSTKG